MHRTPHGSMHACTDEARACPRSNGPPAPHACSLRAALGGRCSVHRTARRARARNARVPHPTRAPACIQARAARGGRERMCQRAWQSGSAAAVERQQCGGLCGVIGATCGVVRDRRAGRAQKGRIFFRISPKSAAASFFVPARPCYGARVEEYVMMWRYVLVRPSRSGEGVGSCMRR